MNTISHNGYLSAGTAEFSMHDQVVALTGGGYCGWIAPTKAKDEVAAYTGGQYLQLKLLSRKEVLENKAIKKKREKEG